MESYKEHLFNFWTSKYYQDLFKFDTDLGRVDHPYQIDRLYHQLELECARYLVLNKYHIIQDKAEQLGLSTSFKLQLYTTFKKWLLLNVRCTCHPLENLDYKYKTTTAGQVKGVLIGILLRS